MRDALARPESQPEPCLQMDEDDGSMLELLADDAFGREAESVAVKSQ